MNGYNKYYQNSAMIMTWIGNDTRPFSVNQIDSTPEGRSVANEKCLILTELGFLEKYGDRWGWFKLRQQEFEHIDLLDESTNIGPVDLWLPFELSDMVEIYPGNILIMAGAKDSGKTGLSLNIAQQNRHNWKVHYFNSEMGATELKKRLSLSEITLKMWQEGCNFYRVANNFPDAIMSCKPDLNSLFIIDFLEIHDEFYTAGAVLKAIHDKLNGAICIINIQKRAPGIDSGPLGGWRSLEVCRVCLSIDYGQVKIKIAKNWRDPQNNPKNKIAQFKLVAGYKITGFKSWHDEIEKE